MRAFSVLGCLPASLCASVVASSVILLVVDQHWDPQNHSLLAKALRVRAYAVISAWGAVTCPVQSMCFPEIPGRSRVTTYLFGLVPFAAGSAAVLSNFIINTLIATIILIIFSILRVAPFSRRFYAPRRYAKRRQNWCGSWRNGMHIGPAVAVRQATVYLAGN